MYNIVEVNKFTIVHTLRYKKSENLVCNNYLIFFFHQIDSNDNDECL